jgi:hypothetical protein
MSESKSPNPFKCARRSKGITVTLAPSDITEVWHSLSVEQAERLLDVNGATIAVQMLAAGIDAAVELIKQDGAAS